MALLTSLYMLLMRSATGGSTLLLVFRARLAVLLFRSLVALVARLFNQKLGADEKERVQVRRANAKDRTQIEDHQIEALAPTRFTSPGRNGKYSQFIWDQKCFSGVDSIEDPDEKGVFRLMNEYGEGEWNIEVGDENENYDFLMGANIEVRNNAVYEELNIGAAGSENSCPLMGSALMPPSTCQPGSSATGSAICVGA